MADKKTVQAVKKVLEESKKQKRKFKQNIDLVFNLKNIDLEEAKNRIDEEIILPNGRGKEAKITADTVLYNRDFYGLGHAFPKQG